MVTSVKPLAVALLGCGTVGGEVARILAEDAEELTARSGAALKLIGVGVRDLSADRGPHVDRSLLTDDLEGLVEKADVVIELMGGLEPAGTLITKALRAGKTVISANKALIAERLEELSTAAAESKVQFSYEAAVAGAIPILRPIRDSLSGDKITRIMGIVNGTTNYILDAMDSTGASFEDALAKAQELGYAEADPTADVGGHDAAAKAAILASLGLHTTFPLSEVYTEGITNVTAEDIASARAAGYVIKFVAVVERIEKDGEDFAAVRVHPTLLPESHPLTSVRGAYNAVYVEAENAGSLMFMGQGAGGAPTASAVMGDVVSAVRRLVAGGPGRTETATRVVKPLSFAETSTRFSIAVTVEDRPGVLEQIARVFSSHGQSIESMNQSQVRELGGQDAAVLRIITHEGTEGDLRRTVEDIHSLPSVVRKPTFMRVGGN
jgi:homoserine dehydrogenase